MQKASQCKMHIRVTLSDRQPQLPGNNFSAGSQSCASRTKAIDLPPSASSRSTPGARGSIRNPNAVIANSFFICKCSPLPNQLSWYPTPWQADCQRGDSGQQRSEAQTEHGSPNYLRSHRHTAVLRISCPGCSHGERILRGLAVALISPDGPDPLESRVFPTARSRSRRGRPPTRASNATRSIRPRKQRPPRPPRQAR